MHSQVCSKYYLALGFYVQFLCTHVIVTRIIGANILQQLQLSMSHVQLSTPSPAAIESYIIHEISTCNNNCNDFFQNAKNVLLMLLNN